MTGLFATDWIDLLVAPVWEALIAVIFAGAAITVLLRRPLWLQTLAADAGVSRLSLLGIEVDLQAAYEQRDEPAPGQAGLRAFATLSARLAPLVRGRGVLWVDDRPDGNRHEAALLRRLGVQVDQVRTTARAVVRLEEPTMPIDLVIADWSRDDDPVQGADLVGALDATARGLPVLFYVGDIQPERVAQAARAGAAGITAEPDELLKRALVELSTTVV